MEGLRLEKHGRPPLREDRQKCRPYETKDKVMKKIIAAVFCLVLSATCFPVIAHSNDEAIYELWEELLERYPSVEALKEQFGSDNYGNDVTWEEATEPSLHDDSIELKYVSMSHPGIQISVMAFAIEGEDKFFITQVYVKEAGFGGFLGIDKGSAKADVLKVFGEPDSIEDNRLIYEDDDTGYLSIVFELDGEDKVRRMRFANHVD